ncbi:hypothetical protein RZE82_09080 [Mollicutes bacterium LVI A0039]|nr:hypothetical protein RZE82_09080 [Mollicutes bacterium LVI A0039]
MSRLFWNYIVNNKLRLLISLVIVIVPFGFLLIPGYDQYLSLKLIGILSSLSIINLTIHEVYKIDNESKFITLQEHYQGRDQLIYSKVVDNFKILTPLLIGYGILGIWFYPAEAVVVLINQALLIIIPTFLLYKISSFELAKNLTVIINMLIAFSIFYNFNIVAIAIIITVSGSFGGIYALRTRRS